MASPVRQGRWASVSAAGGPRGLCRMVKVRRTFGPVALSTKTRPDQCRFLGCFAIRGHMAEFRLVAPVGREGLAGLERRQRPGVYKLGKVKSELAHPAGRNRKSGKSGSAIAPQARVYGRDPASWKALWSGGASPPRSLGCWRSRCCSTRFRRLRNLVQAGRRGRQQRLDKGHDQPSRRRVAVIAPLEREAVGQGHVSGGEFARIQLRLSPL